MIRQTEFLIITECFSEQAPAFAANRPHSVGRSTNCTNDPSGFQECSCEMTTATTLLPSTTFATVTRRRLRLYFERP